MHRADTPHNQCSPALSQCSLACTAPRCCSAHSPVQPRVVAVLAHLCSPALSQCSPTTPPCKSVFGDFSESWLVCSALTKHGQLSTRLSTLKITRFNNSPSGPRRRRRGAARWRPVKPIPFSARLHPFAVWTFDFVRSAGCAQTPDSTGCKLYQR